MSLHCSDHPLSQLVSDSDSEMDSVEQLALGSTETLSNGHKADLEAAKRLAKRLYKLDGFKKADVARHLGKKYVWVFTRNSPFCKGPTCTRGVPTAAALAGHGAGREELAGPQSPLPVTGTPGGGVTGVPSKGLET